MHGILLLTLPTQYTVCMLVLNPPLASSLVILSPQHGDLAGHVVHDDGALLGDDHPAGAELLHLQLQLLDARAQCGQLGAALVLVHHHLPGQGGPVEKK